MAWPEPQWESETLFLWAAVPGPLVLPWELWAPQVSPWSERVARRLDTGQHKPFPIPQPPDWRPCWLSTHPDTPWRSFVVLWRPKTTS